MRNINEKYYEQFSPQERVNLTISAIARNDIKEADCLLNTCPVHVYKIRDPEYSSPLILLSFIKAKFFEQCVYHYIILEKINTSILLSEMADSQFFRQRITGLNKLYNIEGLHIGKLKALFQGLNQFCHQIGIDSNELLKIIDLEHYCSDIDSYLNLNIEPDQEYIVRVKSMFLGYWDGEI